MRETRVPGWKYNKDRYLICDKCEGRTELRVPDFYEATYYVADGRHSVYCDPCWKKVRRNQNARLNRLIAKERAAAI